MFERFNQRSTEFERLDTGDYTRSEYARWQREMWYIHRFFGEIRAMQRTLISDIEGKEKVSVLDVGAGDGGLIQALNEKAADTCIFSVGVELNAEATKAMRHSNIVALQANALSLPFADSAFDVSMCSLIVHHLDPQDAVQLLREMARVGKRIYVFDLNREPLPYYLYRVLSPIFLQRFTVEDGALSILRAYRPEELKDLAKSAGLQDVTITRSKLNRLILSAAK